jgi:hypothetical protein
MGSAADVSEGHNASVFRIDLEDGDSIYLRNFDNTPTSTRRKEPKAESTLILNYRESV